MHQPPNEPQCIKLSEVAPSREKPRASPPRPFSAQYTWIAWHHKTTIIDQRISREWLEIGFGPTYEQALDMGLRKNVDIEDLVVLRFGYHPEHKAAHDGTERRQTEKESWGPIPRKTLVLNAIQDLLFLNPNDPVQTREIADHLGKPVSHVSTILFQLSSSRKIVKVAEGGWLLPVVKD